MSLLSVISIAIISKVVKSIVVVSQKGRLKSYSQISDQGEKADKHYSPFCPFASDGEKKVYEIDTWAFTIKHYRFIRSI